jgi:hypothetical protein
VSLFLMCMDPADHPDGDRRGLARMWLPNASILCFQLNWCLANLPRGPALCCLPARLGGRRSASMRPSGVSNNAEPPPSHCPKTAAVAAVPFGMVFINSDLPNPGFARPVSARCTPNVYLPSKRTIPTFEDSLGGAPVNRAHCPPVMRGEGVTKHRIRRSTRSGPNH